MKLQLNNAAAASEIQLSDSAFGRAYNEALVHQVVTAYMAAGPCGHQGAENPCRGAWRRQEAVEPEGHRTGPRGSIRSPLWVGGGRAFAARPRDFTQKVNRKMYRAAMQSMVSELVRQNRLVAVESLELSAPKTRLLIRQARRTRPHPRIDPGRGLRREAVPGGPQYSPCGCAPRRLSRPAEPDQARQSARHGRCLEVARTASRRRA